MTNRRPDPFVVPTINRTGMLTGARWRGLLQLGQQVLSLIATVVLARFLNPSQIGISAAIMFILGMFGVASASATGLYAAIIRRKVIDNDYLGGALSINLILGIALTAVGLAFAPVLSKLAGISGASSAVMVVMPLLALSATQTIAMAVLDRRMDSGRVALAGLACTLVYVVAEVVLAFLGFGYWAIVVGYMIGQVLLFCLLTYFAGWKPTLRKPGPVWREDGKFSIKFTLHSGIEYSSKNIDYWIVSAVLGSTALGAYYIAFALPTILRVRIHAVMGQLLLPVFSRLGDDVDKIRQAYVSTFCLAAALAVPSMIGIAAITPALVDVLFGSQWERAIVPMRWISVAAIFDFLSAGLTAAALTRGLMRRLVIASATRIALLGVLIPLGLGLNHTISAVAIAVFVSSVGAALANQILVARPMGFPLVLVARPLLAITLSSLAMGVCAWFAQNWVQGLAFPAFMQLMVSVPAGVVAYIVTGLILDNSGFRKYVRDARKILGVR